MPHKSYNDFSDDEGYEDYYKNGVEASGQGKAIDKLLAAGADIHKTIYNESWPYGLNAFTLALIDGNYRLVEFLLSRGASITGWERAWEEYETQQRGSSHFEERAPKLLKILQDAARKGG